MAGPCLHLDFTWAFKMGIWAGFGGLSLSQALYWEGSGQPLGARLGILPLHPLERPVKGCAWLIPWCGDPGDVGAQGGSFVQHTGTSLPGDAPALVLCLCRCTFAHSACEHSPPA